MIHQPRTSALRALAALLATGLAGCGSSGSQNAIQASGHIEATEVRLAAPLPGRLVEAPFREGDSVPFGAIVARLDTATLEHDLTRARAEAAAAEARLELLQAGTREEELRHGRQELARAQAELTAAERDLARWEGLASRGTASAKARDDAATRRDVAHRTVEALRARLDALEAGPRPGEIAAARAQRDAAAATADAAAQRIADATVIAPIAGVLTTRVAEPGEVLPAGSTIAVLTDLEHPWLNVYLDQPSLAAVALGDPVAVRVDGRSEEFPGIVSHISAQAEFTPKNVQTPNERAQLVFRVKVALANPAGVFKPGLPADARFGHRGGQDR